MCTSLDMFTFTFQVRYSFQTHLPMCISKMKKKKKKWKNFQNVELGLTFFFLTLVFQLSFGEIHLFSLFTPLIDYLLPFLIMFHYFRSYFTKHQIIISLKSFGCSCYPYLRPYDQHKFQFHASKCLFLGFNPYYNDYHCLHPSSNSIQLGLFDEYKFLYLSIYLYIYRYIYTSLFSTYSVTFSRRQSFSYLFPLPSSYDPYSQ